MEFTENMLHTLSLTDCYDDTMDLVIDTIDEEEIESYTSEWENMYYRIDEWFCEKYKDMIHKIIYKNNFLVFISFEAYGIKNKFIEEFVKEYDITNSFKYNEIRSEILEKYNYNPFE